MKKETLKTIVLVFLVLSSIILTVNNWFSEKLWPDGYNFFSNLTNYFSDEEIQKSYFLSKEKLSKRNGTTVVKQNRLLFYIKFHKSHSQSGLAYCIFNLSHQPF